MTTSATSHPPELCSQCSIPIEFDEDEFLVDMCVSCDRVRHRRLSAERRRSSEASEPWSPDSIMAAGFEGLSVESNKPSWQKAEFRPPKTTFVFGATTPNAAHRTPFVFGDDATPQRPTQDAETVKQPFSRGVQEACKPKRVRRPARAAPAPTAAAPAAAEVEATGASAEAPTAEAPLPPGWTAVVSKSAEPGKVFYYHKESGTTQWERPAKAGAPMGAAETAAQQPAEAAAAPPPPPSDTTPREVAPSPAICSETNRQAAEEWLDKARKRHEAGDDAAALRFCEKSLRLHEGNEAAAQLAAHLRKFGAGTPMAEAAARVLKLGPREHAAVLQLSATQAASADAVRAAYRKLALLLHPDKNQARQAEAAFKRLQVAYEALGARTSGTGDGGGPSTRPSGGSSGGSSRGDSDDECFCTRCGEECEYGEDLCDECATDDYERAFKEAFRRGRGASSHAYSSHTSRCYDCGRPYSPPASYCGSKPMCRDCRDGNDSDDDYGRYGGYQYGFY